MRAETEQATIEDQASAETYRAARAAAPLLLLALLLTSYVLGLSAMTRALRDALFVQLGAIGLRWGALSLLVPRSGLAPRVRSWHAPVFTVTAWATSAGVANIMLRAEGCSSVQLLELTLISTAVCAIAQRSMAPHLVSYAGYVLIQFSALLVLVLRAPDANLLPVLPVMFAIFMVALGASALRANADLRQRIRLTVDLHESSVRDALTGLRNRRFATAFAEQREAQLAVAANRASAASQQLAFLLIDLDHFKSVNDRFGHDAGDKVLAQFAAIATRTFRAHDLVARWGGEEFLVILEVPTAEDAWAAAERLRSAIAETPMVVGARFTIPVTCSIGGAILRRPLGGDDPSSWHETIQRADANLYRAKAGGRNLLCRDISCGDRVRASGMTPALTAA